MFQKEWFPTGKGIFVYKCTSFLFNTKITFKDPTLATPEMNEPRTHRERRLLTVPSHQLPSNASNPHMSD
jgi:hypothetical protein